jgi:PAS domain S-box-containing protein
MIGASMLAGFAHLGGAPFYISTAMLMIGVGGFVLVWRAQRDGKRLVTLFDRNALHTREEIETRADRMWELQESKERFRGLTDALGDLVVHRDREGRIVYVNRVFARLVGQEPPTLCGRTLAEFGISVGVVPDAAFSDGECLSSTDVAIQTPDGTRWFSWIELSVRDKENQSVSHRAIARDITDRKRAEAGLIAARERAELASSAKSRFLATVSHEIRTPMNGIMGMATLLAATGLSAEQRTYVGAVSTSASALLALIEDLLDFSRIEADRIELEPQLMSPRELAENVVELLAARAYAKGIGFGCHVAAQVPSMIEADPGRLRQVLLNLIGNAIKFTDQGGVLVSVTMAESSKIPSIRFSVTDTGPGITAADRKRIFREFEPGDATRRHGGAGLGLVISNRLVSVMGGTISVKSAKGKGSEFTIELPLAGNWPDFVERNGALDGRRVLVVSSNRVEAEAIARTVRSHGGTSDIASTTVEAARRARGGSRDCDVVLVDGALERAGKLLKRLRKEGMITAEAVIVIAPGDRGRLAAFQASGYPKFLVRPVRSETLLRVLFAGAPAKAASRTCDAGTNSAVAARQRLSVLLAEDNQISAMLVRAALSKAGHDVHVVPNGKMAVDAVTATGGRGRFDVVLMDLHMPVMDGLEAIAVIRKDEEEKGYAPLPIMVLSADGQQKTHHMMLAHGASGFITKPLDPCALVAAIEKQVAT